MVTRARLESRANESPGAEEGGAPINVAVVGAGGIYRLAHGPAWRRLGRGRVVAVCDVLEDRARQAREDLGADAHYTDHREMLRDMRDIHVVDICAPSHLHAQLAIDAMNAGKHVICEKPMAMTPEDALRMMEVARRTGRQIHVGQTRRFDPRWTQLREHVDAGRVGAPVSLRRSERSWGGFPEDDWHWEMSKSGGVLMDLGVHVVDMFSWLYRAQPEEVYAKALTIRPEAKRNGTYDFAVLSLKYPDNRRGLVEVSWAHPRSYAPAYSHTEVIGTKGKITLSDKDTAPMMVMQHEKSEITRYSQMLSAFPEAFDEELGHFLDCVQGHAEPRVTPEEASAAVQVIAAAMRSIREGRPVRVGGGAS